MGRRPNGGHPASQRRNKNSGLGGALRNAQSRDQKAAEERKKEGKESFNPHPGPLRSVTQETSLQEIVERAALEQRAYADRNEAKLLNAANLQAELIITPTTDQLRYITDRRRLLRVPRRPPWTRSMTKEEIDAQEREAFNDWRRGLAELEKERVATLTPFEKNFDVWRQLWRVIERSDVVFQVIDCRHPLLFRSADLSRYTAEVSVTQKRPKRSLLLLNKADLVPLHVRKLWTQYYKANGVEHIYFSALREEALIKLMACTLRQETRQISEQERALRAGIQTLDSVLMEVEEPIIDSDQNDDSVEKLSGKKLQRYKLQREFQSIMERLEREHDTLIKADDLDEPLPYGEDGDELNFFTAKILSRSELLHVMEMLVSKEDEPTVFGVTGYPNVGKSTLINVLAVETGIRTAVAATPGKTKHFQTIKLTSKITLCDCPGLVFPSFTHCRSDLVCSGILSIDNERDYMAPVRLLAARIPARVFEKVYGLTLEEPDKFEVVSMPVGVDPRERYVTAEQVCDAYANKHGYMQAFGRPDHAKVSRILLKDLFKGKLMWLSLPPILKSEPTYYFWVAMPTPTTVRSNA